MSYTLGEAAKATGMSKAAISRAIKIGTISAEKQENGSFKIDPAELHRVYPPVAAEQDNQRSTQAKDAIELNALNRELQAKLEAAMQRLIDKDEVIADLRDDRDRWRTQAEKLLLTDQRPKAPAEVIPMPPPAAPASVEAPPAPPPRVSPDPALTDAPAAAPAPARETSWWRKMVGSR
jgi:hypothetical protein